AIQVADGRGLETAVGRLLRDAEERHRLGKAAQELVRSQQGATERTLECLDQLFQETGWPRPHHRQPTRLNVPMPASKSVDGSGTGVARKPWNRPLASL